jgi:CheY-like chemotaxis protein/HPt (histidine-containing phosphotransfer) domain-containing protein
VVLPIADEKGLNMHFYAEPSLGKKLCGDPMRIRQILVNLLSNAVKFTNSGMVKMLAVITKATEDRATMLFEVKDSGIGMSPEQIETIFDPFTQADSSVTRKFGGTGLGLAISKNFIELMGGTLFVDSTVGLGSKFSFELEFDLICDEEADAMPKQTVFDTSEKPKFNGEVLVCEDNILNQQVVIEHLSRVGLSAVVANDGKEGVDIVKKRLKTGKMFNLIFMDMHMPVMDGLDATEKILELFREVKSDEAEHPGIGSPPPIVALTANVMSDALELYKKSGISDTLGKPFTTNELWQCLIKYFTNENYSLNPEKPSKSRSLNRSDDINMQMTELQTIFVQDHQETYAKIVKALESGDIKTAHRLVHSLKGNAGFIKEARLQEVSGKVESLLAQEPDSDGMTLVEEYMNVIKAELKLVLDKLAPLL